METVTYAPAGDTGVVMLFGSSICVSTNQKIRLMMECIEKKKEKGITELVPSFVSLLVLYDNKKTNYNAVVKKLVKIEKENRGKSEKQGATTVHEIPVCYEGEYGVDLVDVAENAGMTVEETIALHAGRDYLIYMLGFLPGFVYLGGMDERLFCKRLATPRTKIPAGSVGIGGQQTGIYPLESPGGWRLIGTTPLKVYDPDRNPAILYKMGDYIRFVPIEVEKYKELKEKEQKTENKMLQNVQKNQEKDPELETAFLEIMKSGLQSTIQDAGRYGYQDSGFSVSGCMDIDAYRQANMLVNNPLDAAVIEMQFIGSSVLFQQHTFFALTGANMNPKLNGKEIYNQKAYEVNKGDQLTLETAVCGRFTYLSVWGGFQVEKVMGSRSTNLKCKIGGFMGRALMAGDRISMKKAPNILFNAYLKEMPVEKYQKEILLHVIEGPQGDYFTENGKYTFTSEIYTVGELSDRMGYRLEGKPIEYKDQVDILSDGIVFGSIQIPPSGTPMIMMADRQTTGGYAKIGTVIQADLPKLAQCMPGAKIKFVFVSLKEAEKLQKDANRKLLKYRKECGYVKEKRERK